MRRFLVGCPLAGAESASKLAAYGDFATMMTVSIRYFALLREQRGLSEEKLETAATTPAALYEELRARYGFTLPADRIRAAVNGEFVAADVPLQSGAEIVFIPPVAGG